MKTHLLSALFCITGLQAADIYSFDLLPSGGFIAGNPGQTIGWGYTLKNESASEWLVPLSLDSEPFISATPTLLFDFPILAPGAAVTRPFDLLGSSGLLEISIDPGLTSPVLNAGAFTLNAQWWNGDPLAGGNFLSEASETSRQYFALTSVEPGPASAPEPSTSAFVLIGGAAIGLRFLTNHLRPSPRRRCR